MVWILVFGLLGGSIGPLFFQCSWYDVFYAFGLGVLVGLFCLLGCKAPTFEPLVNIASSCIVAFLARSIICDSSFVFLPLCLKKLKEEVQLMLFVISSSYILYRVIYTFTPICVGGVTLSAIVWLLPGPFVFFDNMLFGQTKTLEIQFQVPGLTHHFNRFENE